MFIPRVLILDVFILLVLIFDVLNHLVLILNVLILLELVRNVLILLVLILDVLILLVLILNVLIFLLLILDVLILLVLILNVSILLVLILSVFIPLVLILGELGQCHICWCPGSCCCQVISLFRRRSKKTSKLRVTGLYKGNPTVTGGSPNKGSDSNAENVSISWCRHQMETFSTLLTLYAGNSPVTGEFPALRPVTRSFDVFFDLSLDKRLGKQPRRRWFETPSRPLLRHCNVDDGIMVSV